MNVKEVTNTCINCLHVWKDKPGGFAVYRYCPRCGCHYWSVVK